MCFLVIEIILALGSLLFVISGISTVMHIGNCVGAFICAALFVICIKRAEFCGLVAKAWGSGAGRTAVVMISAVCLICIVAATVISVLMISAANDPPEKAVPAIVLGCHVKENGPSLMLKKRIDAACSYLKENPSAICIASGGKGDDEPCSEAQAIRDRLVECGISPERIIMEDRSVNTFQNIRNSRELLEDMGYDGEAVIITSEFHQLRAKMLARKQGMKAYSISSETYLPLLPSYWVREWFGVVHEFFIGRK